MMNDNCGYKIYWKFIVLRGIRMMCKAFLKSLNEISKIISPLYLHFFFIQLKYYGNLLAAETLSLNKS